MSLSAIEKLLKQRIGLHSATVGRGVVAQAVAQRMRACDLDEPHDYLQIISTSTTELDALIDSVVIPETWFYRDRHPFHAFSEWVRHSWLPHNGHDPLRVLSVPCSSGEEPYTLAMCLADLDLPAGVAQIDAIDISYRNIEKAAAASYGDNSFRSDDLSFRDRHFISDGPRFKLKEAIRERVNFFRINILDATGLMQQQPYDVIFCRNLLIYFDRPTQNQVIDRLEQLLTPEGVLFLGHSETSLLLERDFEALGYTCCFGFRRQPDRRRQFNNTLAGQGANTTPRRSPAGADAPRPYTGAVHNVRQTHTTQTETGEANGPEGDGEDSLEYADRLLDEAFRLADQGQLDEAARRCNRLLQLQQHQVDAHYLLGLVREAAGSIEDAAQMFRKTIYLDPDHHEALAHLSVICRQQGDTDSAQRYQRRARRAQQRKQVEENHR